LSSKIVCVKIQIRSKLGLIYRRMTAKAW